MDEQAKDVLVTSMYLMVILLNLIAIWDVIQMKQLNDTYEHFKKICPCYNGTDIKAPVNMIYWTCYEQNYTNEVFSWTNQTRR